MLESQYVIRQKCSWAEVVGAITFQLLSITHALARFQSLHFKSFYSFNCSRCMPMWVILFRGIDDGCLLRQLKKLRAYDAGFCKTLHLRTFFTIKYIEPKSLLLPDCIILGKVCYFSVNIISNKTNSLKWCPGRYCNNYIIK